MSFPNEFFQTVRGARDRQALANIGDIIRDVTTLTSTGMNKTPQSEQVTTVAVPSSPTASATYTVTINGVVTSYTASGSETQDQLGAGLLTSINGNGAVRGLVVASYASGTLTITGNWPAIAFTVAVSGGTGGGQLGSPSTTTAAASGVPIAFGRVLVTDGYVSDSSRLNVFVPSTANLKAQVSTLTVIFAANELYLFTITVRGQSYSFHVAGSTDTATTATAIATAINNRMPAHTVLAAAAAGVVTLTAEIAGQPFEVSYGTNTGTAARMVLDHTEKGILSDIRRCLAGISIRRMDVQNQTVDGNDPVYKANEPVEYLRRGPVFVQRDVAEAISPGDDIYIETATSGDVGGRLYKTASASRIWLPADFLSWERGERTNEADGLIRARLKQVA